MVLVISGCHTWKNFSENYPQFWYTLSKRFTIPVLGPKSLMNTSFKVCEINSLPRDSHFSIRPWLQLRTVVAVNFSWFQTFAMFWMLYAFFLVIPQRLNFICQREFACFCSVRFFTWWWLWRYEYCLLGCDMVHSGKYIQIFVRNLLLPSSEHSSEGVAYYHETLLHLWDLKFPL
jgi:hypothetical protein